MRRLFSSFAALTLLFALAGGSWGDDAAFEQAEAIERIQSHGGQVEIDVTDPDAPTMSVRFWDADIDDAALVHVRKLPRITELHLDRARVTDAGLENLTILSQLRQLSLSGTRITDAGLRNLPGLTKLELLELNETDITDAGLAHLAALVELKSLDLTKTSITDAGLVHLAGLTELKYLGLAETGVTDAGLAHLRPLLQLEELSLIGIKVGDEGVLHLRGLPQLSCLVFDDTQLTDRGLETLSDMPHLDWLILNRAQITDAGLVHLRKLPKLRVLHVEGNEITDAGLEHLVSLPELEELVLEKTHVTDAGLVHLTRLARLTDLWLRGTHVTDAGLKWFRQMPRLRRVNLQDTRVTPEAMEDLQQAMPICHVMWLPPQPAAAGDCDGSGPIAGEDSSDLYEGEALDAIEIEDADLANLIDILAGDGDARKRRLAAEAIGREHGQRAWQSSDDAGGPGKQAVKALAAASRDDKDDVVRVAAVEALTEFRPFPWDVMVECLAYDSPRVQVVAAAHIAARYEKPNSDDDAEAPVTDEDRERGRAEDEESDDTQAGSSRPAWLTWALQHKDPVVRGLAALAAEEESADRKAALPVLLAALRQEDASPMPERLKNHHIDSVQAMSLMFIGLIGPDAVEAVPVLLDRVARLRPFGGRASDVARSRISPMETGRALVGIGRPAVPELVEHVTTRHGTARLVSAMALAGIGEHRDKAIPVLIRSLYDDSSGYCFAASFHRHDVAHLAVCGHEAVPALLEASRSAVIGFHAYQALTMMEHDAEAVVPLLADALSDPDVSVRRMAASALLFYGDEAEPTIPALRRALKDAEPDVADAATSTLASIRMHSFPNSLARRPDEPGDDEHLKLFAELVRLERLELGETRITGSGLAYLRDYENLRHLTLPPTLTDDGLAHIATLTTLETLDLCGAPVTDAGIKRLRGLTNLKKLDLGGSQLTDAGMVWLRGLTKLEELNLRDTQITGAGMQHLAEMTRLVNLNVGHAAGVDDAGIAHIRKHLGMKRLDLRGTQVTDACLGFLVRMKILEYLVLSDDITDAGVPRLEGLRRLRHLNLGKSKVTEREILRLKNALPECTIWYVNRGIDTWQ